MAMKVYPVKEFWKKLMVASLSVNTIPDLYMSYSRNARIFDAGIWPRRWKQLLTNSVLWTNNKGGFVMNNKLFQIANSKIYEVNTTTGVQTEKATLWYDATTDILIYWANIAIIASPWQAIKVFDGASISTPATVPATNTGYIEYCRWFSFLSHDNVLYISRPITVANPEYSYDWTGSGSQQITYDTNITGLIATMSGIYVFTEDKLEYLWANALQNVAGSATFISTPIGKGSQPINNLCIAADGEKIFYITKNLQVQTVNYIQGSIYTQIGELSARPVVSIKEFLKTIDVNQPSSFAFLNENDKTIQFHIRSVWSPFNDYVLIYDLVNDTWNVDTQKNYNYVVKFSDKYYGFSDVNSSIYQDDVGYSDAWVPIEFRIDTQNMNQGTFNQKIYGWLYVMGGIWYISDLQVLANIDNDQVFEDTVSGNSLNIPDLWEIWWEAIGEDPVWWFLTYNPKLVPFNRRADEGRMYQAGNRIQISFRSKSQIQDFIIDSVWIFYNPTNFSDITEIF